MTYILYNPLANGGHGAQGVQEVMEAFPDGEVKSILSVDTDDFLTSLPEGDRVILCGGDGTINHLVNDLHDPAALQTPVYIWKFGTGNDFWRDAPEKKEKSMVLLNDYTKNLPTVTVHDKTYRFLNNCGIGIDGHVCEMGEKEKAENGAKMNYSILALRAITGSYTRANARVTVDGETREYKKVWLATTTNGEYFGGGMRATPGQDRLSDTVSCIVWHRTPRIFALPLFLTVFSGKHTMFKKIFDLRRGNHIEVEFDTPCAVNIDGEVVSGVTRYTVSKETVPALSHTVKE